MFRKFIRLLLLLFLFSACKKDTPEKKPTPLAFKNSILVEKAGENCDTAAYDCAVITLDVVRLRGESKVADRINRALDRHLIDLIIADEAHKIQNLPELSEEFLSDYREAARNFSEEPPWEAYVKEQIYLHKDNLISIGVTTEIFSGGAHGYKTLTFMNFDPDTGNKLTHQELFTPEFKAFAEQLFRTRHEIPEGQNINSTGFWFENNTYELPENIGFTRDKVVLVYNSYEIAPYAAGDIKMEIPKEKVGTFLKIE